MADISNSAEITTAVPCQREGSCTACQSRSIHWIPPPIVMLMATIASSSMSSRPSRFTCQSVVRGLLMRSQVDLTGKGGGYFVAMIDHSLTLPLVQPAAHSRRQQQKQQEQLGEPMHREGYDHGQPSAA